MEHKNEICCKIADYLCRFDTDTIQLFNYITGRHRVGMFFHTIYYILQPLLIREKTRPSSEEEEMLRITERYEKILEILFDNYNHQKKVIDDMYKYVCLF